MKDNKHNTMEEIFGEVIHVYTRAQAIEDGVLIDVTSVAKKAGILLPTAMTASVWSEYVVVENESAASSEEKGRLWHILRMLQDEIRRKGRTAGDRVLFEVIVTKRQKAWAQSAENIRYDANHGIAKLKAVCGPGDDGSPCITIMKPDED